MSQKGTSSGIRSSGIFPSTFEGRPQRPAVGGVCRRIYLELYSGCLGSEEVRGWLAEATVGKL